MDWRGYRSKGPHGVVYFAFERGDLVKRRLTAYARRRNLKALPIAVASQIIDLMHPNCVDVILATIRAAEQRFGIRVGYIVIDTFAKGIAAGGGDEDKARDQNKCLTNLRRLHERAELHVAIVGHTGKDETRGSRGSNAHPADVDVQVQISGDEIKLARVIKGNDQPEGELTTFKLESAELGIDEDGDPITTAILSGEVFGGQRQDPRLPGCRRQHRRHCVRSPRPLPSAESRRRHQVISRQASKPPPSSAGGSTPPSRHQRIGTAPGSAESFPASLPAPDSRPACGNLGRACVVSILNKPRRTRWRTYVHPYRGVYCMYGRTPLDNVRLCTCTA